MVALCNFINGVFVVFIPPNTTALVQFFDLEIIINMKATYARKTFTLLNSTMDEESVDNTSTCTAASRRLIATLTIICPSKHLPP